MSLDLLPTEPERVEFLMLSASLTIDKQARCCRLCAREAELRAHRASNCVGG